MVNPAAGERLRSEYLTMLELLSTLLEQQGRYADAVAAPNAGCAPIPPTSSPMLTSCACTCPRTTRTPLRTYQAAQVALREELDVAPGAAPCRICTGRHRPMLSRRPGLQQASTAQGKFPVGMWRAHVRGPRELQALQSVWQRCTEGSGQLALVTGEAGISKTRLVEEWLARLARQGIAVATTHCFVGGEVLPMRRLPSCSAMPLSRPRRASRTALGRRGRTPAA